RRPGGADDRADGAPLRPRPRPRPERGRGADGAVAAQARSRADRDAARLRLPRPRAVTGAVRPDGAGSLRLRLLAAGGASVLLALALAGLGLVLLFERHVERRVVLELEADLRQLIDGLERAADGSLHLVRPPAEPRFLEPLSGLYWQIGEEPPAPGGTLLRSRSLWDATLRLPPDPLRGGEVHQHTIPGPGGASLLAVERRVALPASLAGGEVRAVVAVDRAEIHAAGRAFAA